MLRQYELVERVKAYEPDADEALLNRAYVYTMHMHGAQKRACGDPYFGHPIEVAGLITDYKLDTATIVTALLHDTIEDTLATLEDDRQSCSAPRSRELVEGVTKLSKLELIAEHERQAENLRKFILAMSRGRPRADGQAGRPPAQHAHAALHQEPPQAPAHRPRDPGHLRPAGPRDRHARIHARDCEELAFEQLNPEAQRRIAGRLEQLRSSEGGQVDRDRARDHAGARTPAGIQAEVFGPREAPLSIWRKLRAHIDRLLADLRHLSPSA